jgi:hypothetical protein
LFFFIATGIHADILLMAERNANEAFVKRRMNDYNRSSTAPMFV